MPQSRRLYLVKVNQAVRCDFLILHHAPALVDTVSAVYVGSGCRGRRSRAVGKHVLAVVHILRAAKLRSEGRASRRKPRETISMLQDGGKIE